MVVVHVSAVFVSSFSCFLSGQLFSIKTFLFYNKIISQVRLSYDTTYGTDVAPLL